jgi:hypothetical protein
MDVVDSPGQNGPKGIRAKGDDEGEHLKFSSNFKFVGMKRVA